MKITDMNGFELQIDDLQLAILQADDYRHFEHFNPDLAELAVKRRAYWKDVSEVVTLATTAINPGGPALRGRVSPPVLSNTGRFFTKTANNRSVFIVKNKYPADRRLPLKISNNRSN